MIHTFRHAPGILTAAAVGGYEERRGPLGEAFDLCDPSGRFGQKTWEMAEEELARTALNAALGKAGVNAKDISVLCAGDLQNQCCASSGGLYSFGIPFLGLYGACSTCTESLLVASLYLSETYSEKRRLAAAVTTSHNGSAERQFRQPLEYGSQRAPTAQWTATAGGAFLLDSHGADVLITECMPGRMINSLILDSANMGCAMAPAAADSLCRYFEESGKKPVDFDAIVTGDLGLVGASMLRELMKEAGIPLEENYRDCGTMLYDEKEQDVHGGASGCGCSASVLSCFFLPKMVRGDYQDILFLSTGALLSATSVQQGEAIKGIAPLLRIQRRKT